MHLVPALAILAALSACGDFPTAGEPSGRAGYPQLLPLSGLPAGLPPEGGVEPTAEDPDILLRARADALQARADALRQAAP